MPHLIGCGCLITGHSKELHKECELHAQLRAERNFWIGRAGSAVLDSDRLRAERDEARELLKSVRKYLAPTEWDDGLFADIDAALKDAK